MFSGLNFFSLLTVFIIAHAQRNVNTFFQIFEKFFGRPGALVMTNYSYKKQQVGFTYLLRG